MEMRIIATTIILLWSIQTYKCNEGFKPGNKKKFPFSVSPRFFINPKTTIVLLFIMKSLFSFLSSRSYIIQRVFKLLANNAWKFI